MAKYRNRVVRLTSEQEVITRVGKAVMARFDANLQAYREDSVESLAVCQLGRWGTR